MLGRNRVRVLTYIFKHIQMASVKNDENKIKGNESNDEISFESVMQFDLLLLPTASKKMIEEDATLFFQFSGLKNALRMNMVEWLLTWMLAVKKGTLKVCDNFFKQYFNTFPSAKFRLSVSGVKLDCK